MTPRRCPPLAALATCAAVLWITNARTADRPPTSSAPAPTRSSMMAASMLPAGLEPPAADDHQQFVALVVTDIDTDGDLDVVGNDGSLNLIVWSNDSTGRLTRQPPKLPAPAGLRTADTTIDDLPCASTVLAPFGRSSFCPPSSAPSFISDPSHLPATRVAPRPQHAFAAACSPRAPPSPLLAL